MGWTKVCSTEELTPDIPRGVVVNGVPVCVVRTDGEFFAVRNACTHEGVPLSSGEVAAFVIECFQHGSRFDLRTGEVLSPPAVEPLLTYPVRVEGVDLEVDLPE